MFRQEVAPERRHGVVDPVVLVRLVLPKVLMSVDAHGVKFRVTTVLRSRATILARLAAAGREDPPATASVVSRDLLPQLCNAPDSLRGLYIVPRRTCADRAFSRVRLLF